MLAMCALHELFREMYKICPMIWGGRCARWSGTGSDQLDKFPPLYARLVLIMRTWSGVAEKR
jgi:hypothetical protein